MTDEEIKLLKSWADGEPGFNYGDRTWIREKVGELISHYTLCESEVPD